MIGLRHGPHHTSIRLEVTRACHGCDTLIRAGHLCWLDDRAPDAVVCGRCVDQDPVQLADRQSPTSPGGELDGQTRIEMP